MKILAPVLVLLFTGLGLAYAIQGEAGGKPAGAVAAAAQDPLARGPQHAMLQKLIGTWDAVITSADPTGAPQKTKGSLTTVAHTGFHTLDSFDGDFMGMKLLGHGVNGYCAVRKQYFTFWTDGMTPSPMMLLGDYDAKKRELTMTGECFGMSGKLEPCRTVTRYQDDDHYTWTMFGAGPDGKETQLLAIEYSRKK